MNTIRKFNRETIGRLKYYVYRLIDPRNGLTFYVGKGKGNRVFDHVNGVLNFKGENSLENEISAKIKQIKEIQGCGLEVIHVIQRHGMDEKTALEVEAALIDCYAGLDNVQSGIDPERGVCNAEELDRICALAEYDEQLVSLKYVIIKVRPDWIERRGDLYHAVRSAWVAKLDKVKNYPYVLATVGGVVKELYKVDEWHYENDTQYRVEFDGVVESDAGLRGMVVGKQIPKRFRKKGLASPLLYCDMGEEKK